MTDAKVFLHTDMLTHKLGVLFRRELELARDTGLLSLDLFLLIFNIARLWEPDTQDT